MSDERKGRDKKDDDRTIDETEEVKEWNELSNSTEIDRHYKKRRKKETDG